PVLPVTALLLVAGGLALPGTEQAALWLLPAFALAALGLALERFVGAPIAVSGLAGTWVSYVAGTRYATGSVTAAFAPSVQLLSLFIVVVVAGVVARRAVVT